MPDDPEQSDPSTLSRDEEDPAQASPGIRLAVGQTWGKFLIEKKLGRGGQAEVHQAFDQVGPAGHVALKVPRRPVPASKVQEWTALEVDPLVKLDHPNIVRVVDAGCIDGVPYVATQLIDGLPLDNHVKANPPSLKQIRRWLLQVADAIQRAHSQGIVHRDLKPSNVIITPEGKPLVLDFGVARLISAYRPEPDSVIAGTFRFMAPEQARGDADADHRMDVFGLGALLKFLLDHEGPYEHADNPFEAAKNGAVEHLDCRRRPALARDLCRIANRALDPDPSQRYATADQMARALRRVGRHRKAVACTAGLAALALLAALAAHLFSPASRPGAPAEKGGSQTPPQPGPPSRLDASLEVHFQRADKPRQYSILRATSLPLHTGDRIQAHVELTEPLFVHLVSAHSSGFVAVVYPPKGQKPKAVRKLQIPPGDDEWYKLEPPVGTETLILVASRQPLSDLEAGMRALLKRSAAPKLDGLGLLVLDDKGPRLLPADRERPLSARPVTADKGFLAHLLDHVPTDYALVRAISFPTHPPRKPTRDRDEPPMAPSGGTNP